MVVIDAVVGQGEDMTQTRRNSPSAKNEWPTAQQVGELTLAAWHVRQAIREVANGLGVDAETLNHTDVAALLKRRIESAKLPRWTEPSVGEADFVSWLDDASACLDEVDTSVSAAAKAAGDRQPFTVSLPATMRPEVNPSDQLTYRWFTVSSFDTLRERCGELNARGEHLTAALGMRTAGGSTQFGFHHIVRQLYDVLVDPSLSADLRAELTPSYQGTSSLP